MKTDFGIQNQDLGRDMRCHLTIIKWIGLILLMATIMSPILVTLIVPRVRSPIDCEIKVEETDLNQTAACVYVKQYHLSESTYVTVCDRNGDAFVDIRRFWNSTATILGIPLNRGQWERLKILVPQIDRAITIAELIRDISTPVV